MDKKYTILSTSSLLPVTISFNKEDIEGNQERLRINVKIDYPNGKVHFDPLPENCKDLDLLSMEKEILKYFAVPEVDVTDEYHEYAEKVKEVRSGDFATSFMKSNNIDGGNYDGRQP